MRKDEEAIPSEKYQEIFTQGTRTHADSVIFRMISLLCETIMIRFAVISDVG